MSSFSSLSVKLAAAALLAAVLPSVAHAAFDYQVYGSQWAVDNDYNAPDQISYSFGTNSLPSLTAWFDFTNSSKIWGYPAAIRGYHYGQNPAGDTLFPFQVSSKSSIPCEFDYATGDTNMHGDFAYDMFLRWDSQVAYPNDTPQCEVMVWAGGGSYPLGSCTATKAVYTANTWFDLWEGTNSDAGYYVYTFIPSGAAGSPLPSSGSLDVDMKVFFNWLQSNRSGSGYYNDSMYLDVIEAGYEIVIGNSWIWVQGNFNATSGGPPPAPTGLVATAAATNLINLAWNALTNATSYNVQRSLTNGGPYTVIASGVTATSYNDTGLAGGTMYYYVVSAVVGGTNSANSAQASAATLSPTFGSLAHRYSFQESGGTNTADSIGGPVWTGTLPNGGTLANGSLTITTNGHQYAALPAGIVSQLTACTIIGWVNPTVFYAGNRLFDFGNGQTAYLYINLNYTGNVPRFGISTNGFGSEQSVSGSAALTTSVWHQVAITLDGVSTAVLYVDGRPVGTNSGMTIKPSNLGNTVNNWLGRSEFEAYGDTTLVGLLDEFRIYNRALAGAEVATAYALGASQLPVVSGLTATGAATNQINLAWNALTNATSYNVKRSLTNGGPYTVIASGVTATNYADSAGLAGVTTYYYVVSALLSGTESDNSAQAAAATLSPFAYFWGSPVSFAGLNAGQILTNFPGTAVVAAMFAQNGGSSITVTLGGSSIVFAPANTSWASLSGGTGFSTGASTNATGNTNFDSCLNAFYYDTGPHLITLSNLVVGRSYSVQLFALDDRSLSPAGSARTVNWQNPADSSNVSPTYSMADNKYIVMTFVATNAVQVIQENLLNSSCGNFNCLVLRAVMVPGTVTLGNLNQTYDGTAKSASATTTPTNLTVNITYNGSANAPTNAGSYTVIGTINDTYYQGSVTNVLVINQAAGTVTLSNLTQTYDGTAKSASATTTPSGLTVNITYSNSVYALSANAPTNAGSYTVIGTINNANYQGSATNTLVISKGAGAVNLVNLSQTYNGTAKSVTTTTTPTNLTVSITYSNSVYALSANAPTNAGSYTVIGTISNTNWLGSTNGTLVISQGAGTVTLGNLSQTYDGAAKSATATTTPTNLTVNLTYSNSVYALSANAPTNAGSYTVIGTISNTNWLGSTNGTLVISQGTGTVTLSNLSQTYDGAAKSATATTTPTNLTVNITYNGSANAPTNAGSYTVIGTIADANYQGSATNTLVISKGTGTVTLGNLSQTYDGAAKSVSATTTPTNLTVNITYNGSANAPTNAGSYTVVGTINDANYQGSATNTLVISKGAGTVTLGSLSQTYNGTAKSASATTTPSGLTVNLTYNGLANAPTNAGSYTVIGTISDANYQGSVTNTLVVSKGAGTVTLGNLSQTYDGAAKSATATTTPTNLTVNIAYNGSANAPTNAGSYAVIGTISDANYQGSATNTLVISKGAGTVTLGSLSQTYDGTAKSATATTTPSGLTVNLTYSGSANVPTNAGSYTVIGTISDVNYQGGATNTLVISSASRPQMSLALTRTNLAVSWPYANTGYTLQSCTNLTLGNWLNVTSPAVLNVGSNWQVSLPPATNAGSMFYRLVK